MYFIHHSMLGIYFKKLQFLFTFRIWEISASLIKVNEIQVYNPVSIYKLLNSDMQPLNTVSALTITEMCSMLRFMCSIERVNDLESLNFVCS